MSERRDDHAVRRVFAGLFMVVGGLMGFLCGSCTLLFLVGGLLSSGGGEMAILSLFIGGVPAALGIGLFLAGRTMWKDATRAIKPPPAATFD